MRSFVVTPPVRPDCTCSDPPRYWHGPSCPHWKLQPDYPFGPVDVDKLKSGVVPAKPVRWMWWIVITLSLIGLAGAVLSTADGGDLVQNLVYVGINLTLIGMSIVILVRNR